MSEHRQNVSIKSKDFGELKLSSGQLDLIQFLQRRMWELGKSSDQIRSAELTFEPGNWPENSNENGSRPKIVISDEGYVIGQYSYSGLDTYPFDHIQEIDVYGEGEVVVKEWDTGEKRVEKLDLELEEAQE